jgi:predicted nucleic acid-binding protein
MILVDTSTWINHFRQDNQRLRNLLLDGQVICHPFVIGELACGNMKNRSETLGLLQLLPQAPTVGIREILSFIDGRRLQGSGIGFIDFHLLAASLLLGAKFWTEDKRVHQVAERLKIAL